MGSKILVTTNLSDEMEMAGADLVSKLDRRMRISIALWLSMPDSSRWRFVIGSPEARLDGPRKVYRTIQSVLQRTSPSIDISDISVIDDKSALYIGLLGFVRTAPKSLGQIRLTDVMQDGLHIADALVYRIS